MSLGSAYLWFTALQLWPSLCENSETTVHACELSPCFCSASVFSLFKKVGGLRGVGFFSLMGVTLSISLAVGVLIDCVVGMYLAGEKMMTVMAMCIFMVLSLRSINY